MRFIKETHIDFMGKTRLAVTFSTVMILAGIASIVVKGGLNLSIDFKGGTLVAVNYTHKDHYGYHFE